MEQTTPSSKIPSLEEEEKRRIEQRTSARLMKDFRRNNFYSKECCLSISIYELNLHIQGYMKSISFNV